MSNTPASTAGQPSLWRNIISIHPAALKYPRMPAQEFANFSDDIKVNSIKVAIVFYIDRDGHKSLLDGVHRLDGAERTGVLVVDNGKLRLQTQYGLRDVPQEIVAWPVDPYAYAVSLNAHRRHLTPEEKRERIAEALKADPSKSDRAIAKTAGVSPTFVGKVRSNVHDGHKKDDATDLPEQQQQVRTEATGRKARGHKPGKVKPEPKSKLDWQYDAATGEATAESSEPVVIYTISETSKGKRSRFSIRRQTETSSDRFGPDFRTMQAAQQFCEAEVAQWRKVLVSAGGLDRKALDLSAPTADEPNDVQASPDAGKGEAARIEAEQLDNIAKHADLSPPLDETLGPAPPGGSPREAGSPDDATPAALMAALDQTYALLNQKIAWPPLSKNREKDLKRLMCVLHETIGRLREIVEAASKLEPAAPPAEPVDDGIPDFAS